QDVEEAPRGEGEPTAVAEPGESARLDASMAADTSTASANATTAPPLADAAAEKKRAGAGTRSGPADSDTWAMTYSGYFRAPMRIGIGNNTGPQNIAEAGVDGNGELVNPEGRVIAHDQETGAEVLLPKKTTLHRPVIPD